MRCRVTVALVAALLLGVWPAGAGQSPAVAAQTQPTQAAPRAQVPLARQDQAPGTPAVSSAESMGISLKGIRRNLDQLPPEKKSNATGLRYDFFIDVLGKRPPVDFFKDFDLSTKGGVRWGTPTHAEILRTVSPTWVTGGMPYGGFDLLSIVR